jgi:hypothetical protein
MQQLAAPPYRVPQQLYSKNCPQSKFLPSFKISTHLLLASSSNKGGIVRVTEKAITHLQAQVSLSLSIVQSDCMFVHGKKLQN